MTAPLSLPQFASVTSTGHQLVAGPATPGTSTAIVPNGRVGGTTTVTVLLRDAQGNLLAVAGDSTVTVRVSGANTVAQTEVPFGPDGYRFTYTPTAAGTDTVTVRYGGVQVSGSPYTSSVTAATGGFTGTSLRVGYFGMQDVVGTGAQVSGGNWTTTEPIYRLNHTTALSTATLASVLTALASKDVLLVMAFPGAPGSYTDASGDCRRYNQTKWDTEASAYWNNATIRTALAERRMAPLIGDEPWHSHFCGTIPPSVVRRWFRDFKAQYPDSLVFSRLEPHMVRDGWNGSGALGVNYFDKLDYSFATYRGRTRSPSTGLSPRQYFAQGKAINSSLGYGTVYSHNWPNLGDPDDCWPAFGPGDARTGRIHGENGSQDGQVDLCSDPVGTERYWVESIQRHLDVATAAAEDPDAPALFIWQHSAPGALGTAFTTLQKRADFVTMGTAQIRTGEARSAFTGWRTPK